MATISATEHRWPFQTSCGSTPRFDFSHDTNERRRRRDHACVKVNLRQYVTEFLRLRVIAKVCLFNASDVRRQFRLAEGLRRLKADTCTIIFLLMFDRPFRRAELSMLALTWFAKYISKGQSCAEAAELWSPFGLWPFFGPENGPSPDHVFCGPVSGPDFLGQKTGSLSVGVCLSPHIGNPRPVECRGHSVVCAALRTTPIREQWSF